MNKDYKLIGALIPVLLVLSVGLYGIPGAVGDSNPHAEGIDLIDIWSLQFKNLDNSTEEVEVEEIPEPEDNSNPTPNRPPVYNPQPNNPQPNNPPPSEPEPPFNGNNSE
ncbi:MAG: hypothetical protein KKF16_07055 [Euryarchaeota archaeon]|nr:hypothetical protein [Euryarchaeota archaeon]MBV1728947.1 hypothetical protein [Methanobacterium sp.]MBU4548350.1 hypothetical protein [Euryarchaeota archaeon]MBU4608143.1 hypothetical protein [Euryarchaeota archaeon]MBV1755003.1 hypothetical protein [Methanobacterium sp.]